MSGVNTGRDYRLDISVDAGVTWKIVGPVSAADPANSMPTQDVTSQDITGDTAAMCHTGYDQFSMSVSGFVKENAGTDAVSGLNFFTYKEILALVAASPVSARKGLFRLMDDLEKHEGTMLISEFNRTGAQADVQEFSMTLVAEGPDYAHTVVT